MNPHPADRDPIPNDFDNTYGLPERNAFHTQLKYYRNDSFLRENILDDKTRNDYHGEDYPFRQKHLAAQHIRPQPDAFDVDENCAMPKWQP